MKDEKKREGYEVKGYHSIVVTCAFIFSLALSVFILHPSSFILSRGPAAESQMDARLRSVCSRAMPDGAGALLVMDTRTGRLLAVVNAPLAFGQAFPAGSTIKLFTALAALETGAVHRTQRIRCRGRYQFDDFSIYCSHPRDNPDMDLAQALAYSCNYYFATLGERLDGEAFRRYLEAFGFGRRTGVDFSDEAAGRVALESEKILGRAAIGESPTLLVTPIQLLTAFTALINGGRLFRPYIHPPSAPSWPRARPFARHFPIIHEALAAGAAFGTGARASVPGIDLLGKTGTPTVLTVKDKTHAWFVAAAPAEDPEIAVLVFIGRGRGGLNGAPIAGRVLAAYFEGRKGL